MSFRSIIELVVLAGLLYALWSFFNTHKSDQQALNTFKYELDSSTRLNQQYALKEASFVAQIAQADSVGKVNKAAHLALPAKDKLKKIAHIPGVKPINDTVYIADQHLVDTLILCQIDLQTCSIQSALKDSVIAVKALVHANDSSMLVKAVDTIGGLEKRVNKAERKVKWLKTVAWVSTGVAVVMTVVSLR
jgi:hypothetical protein